MFVCMDSTAKYLGTVMPVTQAIWGRFFFHLVSLVIFFLIFKPKVNLKKKFKSSNNKINIDGYSNVIYVLFFTKI